MKKNIIKELLIILLLALVITLTLRMVIYDFIPSKNNLPKAIKYTKDSVIELTLKEIEEQEKKSISKKNNTENLLKSYTIEQSDLKDYVSKKQYKNSKADPSSEYVETSKNKKSNKR